jgi:hypothetical protein
MGSSVTTDAGQPAAEAHPVPVPSPSPELPKDLDEGIVLAERKIVEQAVQ